MPATEFTALGRGNGFPFCANRVDVDSFYDYMTLGGYRKTDTGGASASQINDSLVGAMELFWNSYELDASSLASITLGSDNLFAGVSDVVLQENSVDLEPVDID